MFFRQIINHTFLGKETEISSYRFTNREITQETEIKNSGERGTIYETC